MKIRIILFALSLIVSILLFNGCTEDKPTDSGNNGDKKYSDIVDLVLITAGTFRMGNTGTYSGQSGENPVHQVTITRAFLMGKYEVTQAEWKAVMGSNPSYFKGDSLPIEEVSWYDAVEFCNKLSIMEGLDTCYSGSGSSIICDWNANGYRLPTEAEWEYACKSGTETDFYTGDLTNTGCTPLDANLDRAGWYCGNSDDKTHPVGGKEPNAFVLYDMHGNVWEWCWDYYIKSPYPNPREPANGSVHITRGGCWKYNSERLRSSTRYTVFSVLYCFGIGFRLARTY